MALFTEVRRLKLGLIFTGSYDWIGGLYYLRNIVLSLQTLDEFSRPSLFIFYNKTTPVELLKSTNYPYLTFLQPKKLSVLNKALNKLSFLVTSKNPFYDSQISKYHIDYLYPFNDYSTQYDSFNERKISWIYDFQHKILPELFDKKELEYREREFSLISKKAKTIVVSSEDSKNHLLKFYPYTKAKIVVLPFVSIINKNQISDFEIVKNEYSIDKPYFLVSNQFWQHKNHRVILESIKALKEKNKSTLIVFTGQTRDTRNPEYFNQITDFISKNNLDAYVKILGLIPRADQLALMCNALAVIQPSKFEGWGTVVEDCKTLEKPVILSDISVHREQMGEYGYYFPPADHIALADLLILFLEQRINIKSYPIDKNQRINHFAKSFLNLFAEKQK